MKNSSRPRQRLHSRALVNSQNARDDGDPVRVGKQAAENKVPREPREKRPPVILLDLGACGFHQLAVLDARRTCGLARAAIRSEEHTSELQSRLHLVCRLLLEKKKK